MNLQQYSKTIERFAFYPNSGEKTIQSMIYPCLGVSGEAAELFEKILLLTSSYSDELFEKTLHEVGDSLWYLARLAHELDFTLTVPSEDSFTSDSLKTTADKYIVQVGCIPEALKKSLRGDDQLGKTSDASRRNLLIESVLQSTITLGQLASTLLDLPVTEALEKIADMNVEKLSNREAKSTLHGDGDLR